VPVRSCVVSFLDPDGLRHSVEVQAASLYEAAVMAIGTFRQHDCQPGQASQLEIKVTSPSVTHTVTVKKVREWLDGGAKSPNEKVTKERLKAMLAS
jgi:hypothetical protein